MGDPVYRPGVGWGDVCAVPEGYAHVYVDGFALCCDINGVRQWRVVGPEPLLFVRCDHVDGAIVAIGQGNATGRALVTVGGSAFRSAGMTWGVNPVAVANARLYVVRTSIEYDVMTLSGEVVDTRLMTETSQGIRDVVGADVRFADDWFSRTHAGLKLFQPCERRGVTVGQADPPQIAAHVSGLLSTIFPGEGFEPHLAALPDGRFVVCARTPHGAALRVCPPFPALIGGPPPIDPDPEPEPEPMAHIFTDEQFKAFDAERDKYPMPMSREQCGALLNWAAWTFGFKLNRKNDDNSAIQPRTGIRITKDVLVDPRRMVYADVLLAALFDGTPSNGVTKQPVDLSTAVDPVQPDGVPSPPDPPDPVDPELVARVARLESEARVWQEQVARLTARVIFLESAPQPVDLTARVVALETRKYRVNGQTGSKFSHTHAVTLPVEIVP